MLIINKIIKQRNLTVQLTNFPVNNKKLNAITKIGYYSDTKIR